MIRLYGICPVSGLPDVSTFVIKVDCYLRMVEMPYTLVSLLGDNSTKSSASVSPGEPPRPPKGKLPYIDDGGRVIADSSFIIDYLKATYGDKLGENKLNSEERAIALIVRRIVEEHLVLGDRVCRLDGGRALGTAQTFDVWLIVAHRNRSTARRGSPATARPGDGAP